MGILSTSGGAEAAVELLSGAPLVFTMRDRGNQVWLPVLVAVAEHS